MKIAGNTNVIEAFKMSKEINKVFNRYNLDCPGCKGAGEDTIEKVAINNGLDLQIFLDDLNKALGK